MKLSLCSLGLVSALVLSSCVDSPELDTHAEAVASCGTTLKPPPDAVMPPVTSWMQGVGPLPGSPSSQVAWIIEGASTNPKGAFYVHQVDLENKVVSFTAVFPSYRRADVYAAIVPRNQAIGGIRVPPGPIGPGGTDWFAVEAHLRAADIVYSLH